MGLLEKQQKIVESLQQVLAEVRAEFGKKNVAVPSTMTLSDIAGYLKWLDSSNTESSFLFHFEQIDQFGTPSSPERGQKAGGVFYNPSFELYSELPELDFGINPLTGTSVPKGVAKIWGYPGKLMRNITPSYEPRFEMASTASVGSFLIDSYPKILNAQTEK